MKCSTCKHWIAPNPESWITDEPSLLFGRCTRTPHDVFAGQWDEDYEVWEINDKTVTALVQDGSGYMARLITKAEHGCTMWSEKE